MRRTHRLLLGIVAGSAALTATPAEAITVGLEPAPAGPVLQISDPGGEKNFVGITLRPPGLTEAETQVVITDSRGISALAPGCAYEFPTRVHCPRSSFSRVRVSLGAAKDLIGFADDFDLGVTVNGGKGNDTLGGTRFADRLNGGAGRDLFNAGPGKDLCIGGPGRDKPNDGCERTRGIP